MDASIASTFVRLLSFAASTTSGRLAGSPSNASIRSTGGTYRVELPPASAAILTVAIGYHPIAALYASSRRSASAITAGRLRAPCSAAMKWFPIHSENASIARTSTSSPSGQKAPNSERR